MFGLYSADRSKRPRLEKCIIHMSDDESSDLTSAQDIESWNTLVRAARIRNYKSVIDLANAVDEGVIPPTVMYHRRCRSLFTMKRDLPKLSAKQLPTVEGRPTNTRQAPENSRTYNAYVFFAKGSNTKRVPEAESL